MKHLGAFLERFALPLVLGGEVHVGKPLHEAELVRWGRELGFHQGLLAALDEHRTLLARRLVVRSPPPSFDEADLRLCAAVHNVLVLQNPGSRGITTRPRMLSRVRDTALAWASLAAPTTRKELLLRHTLLSRLPFLSRTDVRLSWWTGRADFRGQRPPRRLLLWTWLRRVRVEREVVPASELFAEADGERVAHALYAASPLTSVLHPTREAPAFSFAAVAPILRDAELARAVSYSWIGGVPDAARVALHAAAGGKAWTRMLEGERSEDVRAVTAFLVHVCALLALAEVGGRDLDAPSEILRAVLDVERGSSRREEIMTLLSLPDVAAAVDPALALPPGLNGDTRLSRRWKAHRSQVRAAFSDERVRGLATRLRRALGSADSARISGEP